MFKSQEECHSGLQDRVDQPKAEAPAENILAGFIQKKRAAGCSQSTLRRYQSAWRQFQEYMVDYGYQSLEELSQVFPMRYNNWLLGNPDINKNNLSRKGHLGQIKRITEYACALDHMSSPKQNNWSEAIPEIQEEEKIRDGYLSTDRGNKIMDWVRGERRYTRADALWTLIWECGLRKSAVLALDRSDLILHRKDSPDYPSTEEFVPHLKLRDRPGLGPREDDGLPLKNTKPRYRDRRIPLSDDSAESLRGYVFRGTTTGAKDARKDWEEIGEPDEYGKYGLITGERSARISGETLRERIHWITCPTTHSDQRCDCKGCTTYRMDHEREPSPSHVGRYCDRSRPPHECRHGAVTDMLNRGERSLENIAKVVGTSPQTIKDQYDRADEFEELLRIA